MSISLASIPFFANLNATDMMASMSATKTIEVPANTTVFWKGNAPDALYIVLSGRLKNYVRDQKRREAVFATLKPGDYFGEMGIIYGEPRSANVSTIEPCTFLRLGATEFKICLQTNFRIVRTVLKGLSARMLELNARNAALQH
jgi:CRP-like cAMP-binding protein